MAHFIYFISGLKFANLKQINEAGLEYTIDNKEPEAAQILPGQGPGKMGGSAYSQAGHNLGMRDLTKLTWTRLPEEFQKQKDQECFVGFDPADPPTPEELEKQEMLDGHYVKMGDGNEWVVPVARVFSGGSALPVTLCLGTDNELIQEPLPEYVAFSKQAERLWNYYIAEANDEKPPDPLTDAEAWQTAALALSLNYRVRRTEINLLKLLRSTNLGAYGVAGAIIDMPTIIQLSKELELKKKSALTPGG